MASKNTSSLPAKLIPEKEKAGGKKVMRTKQSDFARLMLHHPSMTDAANIISEQSAYEYDRQHGGELEALKIEVSELDDRYIESSEIVKTQKKKLRDTNRLRKSAPEFAGIEKQMMKFKDWSGKDQVLFSVTFFLLITAMVMGASNIYANLMASGQVIFADSPALALMLSTLFIVAASSLKMVSNFIDINVWRRMYALLMYALTFLFLIIWGVLYALNFQGLSSSMDWDSIGDSNSTGSLFVWSQLMLELFSATALFLALEDIYLRYSPEISVETVEYKEQKRLLDTYIAEHDKLCADRNQKRGRQVELAAARQAYINEKTAEYIALRGRYDKANNPNFDV